LGTAGEAEIEALRSRLKLAQGQWVIGTVTRFEPEKGISLWLDAVELVIQRLPSAVFLLIGDGRMREEMLKAVQRRGLARHLRVITDAGMKLAPYYSIMNVYLQTSLVEGFPNAIQEAIAFDLPIVATDVGGTREAIGRGRAILCSRDPLLLADSIVKMIPTVGKSRAERHLTQNRTGNLPISSYLATYGYD
jgi:glycosyltransferase involved in cell wall biosynthesis